MKIIVTCGPAYAPIDEVRRITNFSSGELGALLTRALAEAGHEVTCFRGHYATFRPQGWPGDIREFTTNDNLFAQLESMPDRKAVGAVLHAAALCDYEVQQVTDESRAIQNVRKLSSRDGYLTLTLVPARKVIRDLPRLFPAARVVGWKYELDGSREDAIRKGMEQLTGNETAACVVNGAAYGPGFGFCTPDGNVESIRSKAELCAFLVTWVAKVQ